eukprot:1437438-Pyramimonas_sp.AAC.1
MGPRNAVVGKGDACGLRHGDLRWSFPYGATKRVRGVPESMAGAHADCHWDLRRSSYGATKRVR